MLVRSFCLNSSLQLEVVSLCVKIFLPVVLMWLVSHLDSFADNNQKRKQLPLRCSDWSLQNILDPIVSLLPLQIRFPLPVSPFCPRLSTAAQTYSQ